MIRPPSRHTRFAVQRRIVCLGTCLMLALSLASVSSAQGPLKGLLHRPSKTSAPAAPLRYKLEEGRNYIYRVEIVARTSDYVQKVTGFVSCLVQKVDPDTGVACLMVWCDFAYEPYETNGTRRTNIKPIVKPGEVLEVVEDRRLGSRRSVGGRRRFWLTSQGEITKFQGSGQIPFLMGEVRSLIAIPLPADTRTTWKTTRELIYESHVTSTAGVRPGSSPLVTTDGPMVDNYRLKQVSNGNAVIEKDSNFSVRHRKDSVPILKQTGQGSIRFDTVRGIPTSIEMDYVSDLITDYRPAERSISLRLRLNLLDQEATDAVLKQRLEDKARYAAIMKAQSGKGPSQSLDGAAIDRLKAELDSGDVERISEAAMTLLITGADASRRGEISKKFVGMLRDTDPEIRTAAANGLITWATPDYVPDLIEVVREEEEHTLLAPAVTALAMLADRRSIECLADCLVRDRVSKTAMKGLIAIGPEAEDAVVPLLVPDEYRKFRPQICSVLEAIGSEKSIGPLETLAVYGNVWNGRAKKAILAIQLRQKLNISPVSTFGSSSPTDAGPTQEEPNESPTNARQPDPHIAQDATSSKRPAGGVSITHAPVTPKKKQNERDFGKLIRDLNGSDRKAKGSAISWLQLGSVVEQYRPKIAEALGKQLTSPDQILRARAVGALIKWGTPDNVPDLIRVGKSGSRYEAYAAIKAVAAIGDPRYAELIDTAFVRQPARATLQTRPESPVRLESLGPEEALLYLLDQKKIGMDAQNICELLGHAGTEKSLRPLMQVILHGGRLEARAAKTAYALIEQRIRAEADSTNQ